MPVTIVLGAQWGDEAKGKVADLLSGDAAVVARFNGGDNAGHTVINPYGTFKLRLLPNGFASPETRCVIGPGVAINLQTLVDEIEMLEGRGLPIRERLWISPRCHVVMPYHPLVEAIYENAKGDARTGTTRRGMGPVYADKVSYNGIRLADLADRDVFADKLRVQLAVKNPLLEAFGTPALDLHKVMGEKLAQYEQVQAVVREPFGMLQEALQAGKLVVMEGAQAALLDTDWGTYPFSTASTTLVGGATAGLGIAPRWIERVIGVAKAYLTRVGSGPFPTELTGGAGYVMLQRGQEYGTVTGRPRRCGWLDVDLLRFTAQLNGFTELVLTKLDVLDSLEELKIGVGYRHPEAGESLAHYWQGDARWLERCEPVYTTLSGWMQSTAMARSFGDLPQLAQAYVRRVEALAGVPVSMISVGPERSEIIPVPAM
jgi:adenylosuccinate synthase